MAASHAEPSLTHASGDKLTKEDIAAELQALKQRLTDPADVKYVDELSEFELGRFLIKNKGALSGYWTWYVILGFNSGKIQSQLEKFILEKAPVILATRERFGIFQQLLIDAIQSHSVVCSVPCGMMADLLTLELPEKVQEVRFVGIDFDGMVFQLAQDLAKQVKCGHQCDFFKKDAWALGVSNQYDVVTTNGLNIYEKDDDRVVALYKGLHETLKVGGTLICSALTPPPTLDQNCEWDFAHIDQDALKFSAMLFRSILAATWANFRSSAKTVSQLEAAGFENVQIHWDTRKMFPTFSAQKLFK